MAQLNPTNFFNSMQQMNQHEEEDSLLRYQQRVLKALSKLYPAITYNLKLFLDESVKHPLEEVKFKCAIKELDVLYIERPTPQTEFSELYYDIYKTSVFKKFLEIGSTLSWDSNFGVVFPLKHHKDWVIHNLGSPKWTKPVFVIPSNSVHNRDIRILSLSRFIEERLV